MAADHDAVVGVIKRIQIAPQKGLSSFEAAMKPSMCLPHAPAEWFLAAIQVRQNVLEALSATYGDQDHPVAVGNEPLGSAVLVVEEMHILRVIPASQCLVPVTAGVVRHDLQALGIRNFLIQQVIRPCGIELSRPLSA
ncbi:hypothetical protein D3C77_469810 [compost metagenome]